MPLDAPKVCDFPKYSTSEDEGKYLVLEHAWDIPWPRGMKKEDSGPVWDRRDCNDVSLSPIARGGETLALERLRVGPRAQTTLNPISSMPTML